MEDTLHWLERRIKRCQELAREQPQNEEEFSNSAVRYMAHANHVRLLRETLKSRWCPKCCATSSNDIRCGVCDSLLLIDMGAVRRLQPDELKT